MKNFEDGADYSRRRRFAFPAPEIVTSGVYIYYYLLLRMPPLVESIFDDVDIASISGDY